MMKRWVYTGLVVFLLCATTGHTFAQEEPPFTLHLLGEQQVPTGTIYENTEVGGLSGITYNTEKNEFYAISDDRSELAPARFYTLLLDITEDQFSSVTFTGMTTILQEDGTVYPRRSIDAEAIRYVRSTDSLLWSSEANAEGLPTVRETALDGTFMTDYPVPNYYLPGEDTGIRENSAFESMALSEDEQYIYIGTENALLQDGDAATLEAGSPSRILVLERESGDVFAEYIYETGPIPVRADPPTTTQDNGLVALLPYGDTNLLAIERSFVLGVGNTIGIYLVELSGATNVMGESNIAGLELVPAAKTHILTLEEGTFDLDIDNIEGATWGPELEGQRTLVLVSDNNFNPPAQMFTQFLVFVLED